MFFVDVTVSQEVRTIAMILFYGGVVPLTLAIVGPFLLGKKFPDLPVWADKVLVTLIWVFVTLGAFGVFYIAFLAYIAKG